MTTPMSGRRAQAARNDKLIIEAAQEVFIADPTAPIAAVAERAGVGISALYRRYPSKEDLLRTLCSDGLRRAITIAEKALADDGDPWRAFTTFVSDLVDAQNHAITIALAGTFQPSEDLYHDAVKAEQLNKKVLARAQKAGVVRADVNNTDIDIILEQLATLHVGDDARKRQLRRRYMTLMLNALHEPPQQSSLPGPRPKSEELSSRWG